MSEFCVILVKWQGRPLSKCLMRKSNQSLCMVQKYGAFSVLVWSKKCTLLLVNVFERPTEDSNVYGDLGRYHLFVNLCIRAVKYWFRLVHMKENRLPKNKPTTCKLTWNWMANVFGLLNSGICCVNLALVLFSCKRVLGMKRPFWQFSRNDSVIILTKRGLPLLTAVRDFVYISASLKSNILTGNYLDFVWIKCLKDILIQLRMGVLPVNANRFRYAHENASKILCSVCETKIEDKVHFICFCPLYNVLRQKYIHRYLQTEHSFTILMECHVKNSSQNLPFFVFHACKKTWYLRATETDWL